MGQNGFLLVFFCFCFIFAAQNRWKESWILKKTKFNSIVLLSVKKMKNCTENRKISALLLAFLTKSVEHMQANVIHPLNDERSPEVVACIPVNFAQNTHEMTFEQINPEVYDAFAVDLSIAIDRTNKNIRERSAKKRIWKMTNK